MKKHRKQSVNVVGEKRLVDVPVDDALYKADNREDYQRRRSKAKHVPLEKIAPADYADVMADYEKTMLLVCLREALQALSEKDRLLIEHIYFDGLTEKETAAKFIVTRQAVNKAKHQILEKLRNSLVDWM